MVSEERAYRWYAIRLSRYLELLKIAHYWCLTKTIENRTIERIQNPEPESQKLYDADHGMSSIAESLHLDQKDFQQQNSG